MQVITNKYKVTIREPNSGAETSQTVTASNEMELQEMFRPLQMEIINCELLETTEETIEKRDDDDNSGTHLVNSNVRKAETPMNIPMGVEGFDTATEETMPYQPPATVVPQQGYQQPNYPQTQYTTSAPLKPRIIKQGNLRLKILGDKIYTEEWVECDMKGFKIMSKDTGKQIKTDSLVVYKKDWVEIIDEEESDISDEPNGENLEEVSE